MAGRMRSCMETTRCCAIVSRANGSHSSATRRRTVRGSVAASIVASSVMQAGSSMDGAMAARNSACFDWKCLSTAAGVTCICPAMSARVAESNPLRVKTARAVRMICSRVMTGGRPIAVSK